MLILAVIAISFITFLPEIKDKFIAPAPPEISGIPEVKINFKVIDSEQVKDLEPFNDLQLEFNYAAKDSNGLEIIGVILSKSKESALLSLQNDGFEVVFIEQTNIGRLEPFIPY